MYFFSFLHFVCNKRYIYIYCIRILAIAIGNLDTLSQSQSCLLSVTCHCVLMETKLNWMMLVNALMWLAVCRARRCLGKSCFSWLSCLRFTHERILVSFDISDAPVINCSSFEIYAKTEDGVKIECAIKSDLPTSSTSFTYEDADDRSPKKCCQRWQDTVDRKGIVCFIYMCGTDVWILWYTHVGIW